MYERSKLGKSLRSQKRIRNERGMWVNLGSFAPEVGIHVERLEPGIPPGIPDIMLTSSGPLNSSDLQDESSVLKRTNPLNLEKATIFVETKFERHKLRPDQRAFLRRHKNSGGRCIVWSIKDGVSLLITCQDLPVDGSLPERNIVLREEASSINWNRLIKTIWESS